MNQNTVVRQSFSNGIVSPGIRNRTDWDKHDMSVADALNFLVGPAGEMRKRPGTRFVDYAISDIDPGTGEPYPVRLVEFDFSLGQSYILEFGQLKMRVYMNGAAVLDAAGRPYERSTPYTAAQAREFQFTQDHDLMIFTHWDAPTQTLTRHGHADWRWGELFADASRIGSVYGLDWYDAGSNGHNNVEYAATAFRTVNGTRQESIGYQRLQALPPTIDLISQQPQNNVQSCINWIKTYRAKYGHLAGFPTYPEEYDLSGINEDAWPERSTTVHPKILAVLKQMYGNLSYITRELYYYTYTPSGGPHYYARWQLFDAGGNRILLITYGQSSQAGGTFYPPDAYASQVAARDYTWILLTMAQNHVNAAAAGLYGAVTSFINTTNTNNSVRAVNRVKWQPVAGAEGYYVYRRDLTSSDPAFHLMGTTAANVLNYSDDLSDENNIPKAQTPIQGSNSFTNPDDYPACCAQFQQRLILGRTKRKPTTIWGSKSGQYTNWEINPSDQSSGYEFKMASDSANFIKAILQIKTLYILTSSGAFMSTVTGAMSASNVNFNQEAYLGTADIQPLIIDRTGVYVPLHRQSLNMLNYSYADDGFADENMMFPCQSLTEDRMIEGIAHQRAPSSLIWAALSDGTLLSCIYIPKQGFQAWTRHRTRGRVLSVCAYTNQRGVDELYLVTERERPDGSRFRAIEAIEDTRPFTGQPSAGNAYFVDCGLSASFPDPVTEISGLDHLEGMEVAVLADMSVQNPQVVSGGKIRLDNPASVVHAGLPYEAALETLDLEMQGVPTLRGTRRRVLKAQVEAEKTRDLTYSLNGGDAYDVEFQTGANIGLPLHVGRGDIPISGKAETTNGAFVRLSSRHPLPCTINSIVAEVQYAG